MVREQNLPAGFLHAGDLSLVSKLSKTDTAYSVLFKNGMRAAANAASRVRTS